MEFNIKRNRQPSKPSWTNFNKGVSDDDYEPTTVGYVPLTLSPAHEYDTLYTVVQKCKYIAEAVGQKFVVLTVDEALYCRLM